LPETDGSRRCAALPTAATDRWGSGGRTCLRCRHSTHAQESRCFSWIRVRAREDERRFRGCDEDARSASERLLQCDDQRDVRRGADEPVTRSDRRISTCRSWQPCERAERHGGGKDGRGSDGENETTKEREKERTFIITFSGRVLPNSSLKQIATTRLHFSKSVMHTV